MKRFSLLAAILIMMTAISAAAATTPSTAKEQSFPGTLANARYVYVASYDGDQFNPNLLPEDRAAIGSVQNAIQNWGGNSRSYTGPPKPTSSSLSRAALPKM